MIGLYTANTFNGQRVAIMQEETELPYSVHRVDLMNGEQQAPDFFKHNSSGRIPVIVDLGSGSFSPYVLTQSVTILKYLAEKRGQLMPEIILEKARVYEWKDFHTVDSGSNLFSAFYLQQRCQPPQKQAAELLQERVVELYRFFNEQLENGNLLPEQATALQI